MQLVQNFLFRLSTEYVCTCLHPATVADEATLLSKLPLHTVRLFSFCYLKWNPFRRLVKAESYISNRDSLFSLFMNSSYRRLQCAHSIAKFGELRPINKVWTTSLLFLNSSISKLMVPVLLEKACTSTSARNSKTALCNKLNYVRVFVCFILRFCFLFAIRQTTVG